MVRLEEVAVDPVPRRERVHERRLPLCPLQQAEHAGGQRRDSQHGQQFLIETWVGVRQMACHHNGQPEPHQVHRRQQRVGAVRNQAGRPLQRRYRRQRSSEQGQGSELDAPRRPLHQRGDGEHQRADGGQHLLLEAGPWKVMTGEKPRQAKRQEPERTDHRGAPLPSKAGVGG
jgi:hypothetical protein